MMSTTRITTDTDRIIFGEGIMALDNYDELSFQFTYYKSDAQVRVHLESGKVGIEQRAHFTQKAKKNALEAVSGYIHSDNSMIINPLAIYQAKSKILGHTWTYTIIDSYDCYKIGRGTIHTEQGEIHFKFSYNALTGTAKIIKGDTP